MTIHPNRLPPVVFPAGGGRTAPGYCAGLFFFIGILVRAIFHVNKLSLFIAYFHNDL